MIKPFNVFINNTKLTEQYCFIIDNRMYYKFNGKYALYELSVVPEKKEYAQRIGNSVEQKQVHGFFTGDCPECGSQLQNVPVIKTKGFVCLCEQCSKVITPSVIIPLADIIDVKTVRLKQLECINYEEVEFEMDEDDKPTEEEETDVYDMEEEEYEPLALED
jgi:hypothetical protein